MDGPSELRPLIAQMVVDIKSARAVINILHKQGFFNAQEHRGNPFDGFNRLIVPQYNIRLIEDSIKDNPQNTQRHTGPMIYCAAGGPVIDDVMFLDRNYPNHPEFKKCT